MSDLLEALATKDAEIDRLRAELAHQMEIGKPLPDTEKNAIAQRAIEAAAWDIDSPVQKVLDDLMAFAAKVGREGLPE